MHQTSGIERARPRESVRAYGTACAWTHVSSCERGREGESERGRERETVTETETKIGLATWKETGSVWKGTGSVSAGGTGRTNRAAPLYREIAGLAAWAATART